MQGDIIVISTRIIDGIGLLAFRFGAEGFLEPFDFLSDGSESGDPPQGRSYGFRPICTSIEGLAKAMSDRVGTLPDSDKFEFSETIVGAGGGQHQIFRDRLSTQFLDRQSSISLPEAPASVELLFHSHPATFDENTDAENRYPRPEDWRNVENFVDKYKSDYPNVQNIKLAIRDYNADVRVFRYSQHVYLKNLSSAQKLAGLSLPAPITSTTGCTGL